MFRALLLSAQIASKFFELGTLYLEVLHAKVSDKGSRFPLVRKQHSPKFMMIMNRTTCRVSNPKACLYVPAGNIFQNHLKNGIFWFARD